MYSKFEVSVGDYYYGQEINGHLSTGHDVFDECRRDVKSVLEQYILPNGTLDGDMISLG